MDAVQSRLFDVCPKTGKVVALRVKKRWLVWLFPLVGLASLVWFLVRVIPKPSRAGYPCQRVAAPLASTFVLWLSGVLSSTLVFRQAKQRFLETRYRISALCALIGVIAIVGWGVLSVQRSALAEYPPHPANQPVGVARGPEPGRVVWVYDRAVTDWAGPGTGQRWYEDVNQAVAGEMLSRAIRGYAGTRTDQDAWEAIFRHFNQSGTGYTPGEKLMIKINLTTSNAGGSMADEAYNQLEKSGVTLDSISHSPPLLHALLEQLVNVVGVAQSDITIGDPTGLFVNYLYNPLHPDFPHVRYLDNRGTFGRTRAEFSASPQVPFYWSTTDADTRTQDYVPAAFAEATYVINFGLLKSHGGAGITVNAKNHYGSLLRCPDGYLRGAPNTGVPYNNYYDMHATLPGMGAPTTLGHYRALVDLMGHAELGGKTLLYLVDGIFGGKGWNSVPSRWTMTPFNNDWPSSLFLSMDPVAIESVAADFLAQQWPTQARMNEGVEDFLHEAALAGDPPSGAFYDPERDGIPMASLGVHEHWNNVTDKQYTRNLNTGNGIELISLGNISVTVGVTATDAGAAESGLDVGQFTISRAGDMGSDLAVQLSIGGTAAAGSDYYPLSSSVTISAGNSLVVVTLVPMDDLRVEPAETVTLTLLSGSGYTVNTLMQTASVAILDNDRATFLPIILRG